MNSLVCIFAALGAQTGLKHVFQMDIVQVREDARKTSTEMLLDRVTVYRAEIESPAMEVIEAELRARGVTTDTVAAHAAMRQSDGLKRHSDGTVVRCNY